MLMGSQKVLQSYRDRLSDIPWLMPQLADFVARKAYADDECTGRFWERRFKSQPLLNEAATLACSAYVDLNPVRAGIAETPETSDFKPRCMLLCLLLFITSSHFQQKAAEETEQCVDWKWEPVRIRRLALSGGMLVHGSHLW